MSRPTQIQVDLTALQHNLFYVKNLAPKCRIISMLKANGYGHGLMWSAKGLFQTDAFGVVCLEEAVLIRQAGLKNNIVLVEGFFQSSELSAISYLNCEMVVHSYYQLEILEAIHSRSLKPIKVWLKINTGMNRLGFSVEEFSEVYERLQKCQIIQKPIHFMTHFAESDEPNKPTTQKQIQLFRSLIKDLPGEVSMANSGAILAFPETRVGWIRPGIMLYGVSPFLNKTGKDLGLRPAMRFSSKVIAVRQQKKGDAIGYGGTFVCPEDMLIGIVPVGYGDGYPRQAGNGTPVLVNEHICPLIGRVAMDVIAVDLRPFPQAQVNDSVLLWGEELPVETIATFAKTIPYELLCGISRRVFKKEKNLWEP